MTATNSSLSNEEYELQFYEFTASDFVNCFRHLISSEINNVLDDYLNTAQQTLEDYKFSRLKKFKDDIVIACEKELDEEIKISESMIKKFLRIPSNVLLPTDKSQKQQYSDEELEKLESEVKELEKECIKEQLMIHLCKSEMNILHKIENCKTVFKNCLQKLSRLEYDNNDLEKLLSLYEQYIEKK